ncbi:MAG: hypothetical protein ACOC2C_05030 [Cyclonatronaceae bacterium]
MILGMLLLSISAGQQVVAQSPYSPLSEDIFSDALEQYRNGEYEKAAQTFSEIDELPEARLLQGNSLYALGRYQEASRVLENVIEADLIDVSQEARFTLALTALARRNYEAGLLHLYELEENNTYAPELARRADEQLMAYARFLSYEQRTGLLENESVRQASGLAFVLLREGMRAHTAEQARALYSLARQIEIPDERLRELRRLLENEQGEEPESVEEEQQNEETGEENKASETSEIPELSVPEGFTYHIGVVLPQQERDERGYEVSRSLYFGLLLAAEEFNKSEENRRVQLHLVDFNPSAEAISDTTAGSAAPDSAAADSASAAEAVPPPLVRYTQDLLDNQPIDLLFGPLFSSEAAELSRLAKDYEIPLIAPLANAEDLTEDNAWVFHANPTFGVRGRRMAEIVTQYLGQRRISILVERGSLGEVDALAFRSRAIELGAEIPYFFNENLQARQFEVRPFARFFTSDVGLLNIRDEEEAEEFEENLKPSDALYVPLTGQPASTVFSLLMTQLRALRSNIQVIGSQELGSTDLSEAAARRFELVYPETFYRDTEEEAAVEAFSAFDSRYEERFGQATREFSYMGYNIGQFMQNVLKRAGNPQYAGAAIRALPLFEGLGQRIHFDGGQINTALIPMQFGDDGYRPMFIPQEPIFDLVQERAEEMRRKIEENEGQE